MNSAVKPTCPECKVAGVHPDLGMCPNCFFLLVFTPAKAAYDKARIALGNAIVELPPEALGLKRRNKLKKA